MKKFLSLVLALVMTMSLVTISAGAKGFNDNADITYGEAVAVVSEAGIIDGYTDGSFRPEAKLTRGAAAKIICNMILGPTTAAELAADSAPYPDVPTTNTFAGYIAYCQKEGIISGYADGNFYPGNPLTGYAFMKMLLCALGYDAEVEGYTGANWSINVAKQALAIDLDDDLVGAFNGTKQLSREEACLYAFNTLKAVMVEYSEKTEIQTGNATVTISGNRTDVRNTSKTNGNIEEDAKLMEFAEKYFDDLEAVETTDDFGRPATKWMWDGEKVGTYADSADAILVVGDAEKSLYELITDGDYMDIDEDDVLADAPVYYNGDEIATFEEAGYVAGKGDIIEVFENSKHDVDTIVIRSYTYAKIDKIDDDLSKALKNKDASVEIELIDINEANMGTFYDDHTDGNKVLKGFNAETYVEDAVIAIAVKASTGKIIGSYAVESVAGIPSAARAVAIDNANYDNDWVSNGTITIEGTKYTYAAQFVGLAAGEEVDFDEEYVVYLTAEGYALAVDGDAIASLDDVYYLVGIYGDTIRGKDVAYAQVVNVKDGTEAEFLLDDDYETGTLNQTLVRELTAASGAYTAKGGFYTFDKDGTKYDVKKYNGSSTYDVIEGDTLTSDVTRTSTVIRTIDADSNATKLYIEDETFFIGVEDEAAKIEITTATGIMTADKTTAGLAVYAIYDDDDAVVVIYAAAELAGATNKDDVVFLTDDAKTKTTKDTWVVELVTMADMEVLKDVEIDDDGEKAEGFYTYVLEDGVYELQDKAARVDDLDENGEISEDSDGYDYNVTFTDVKKSTATGTSYDDEDNVVAEYVAVSFADAKVIDTRSGSAKKADIYSNTIDSASKLATAIDKGEVVASVYVEDGDIIFVAIVSCENETAVEDDNDDDNNNNDETALSVVVDGRSITIVGTVTDVYAAAKEINDQLTAKGFTNISIDMPEGESDWAVSAKDGGINVSFIVDDDALVIE